MSRSPQPPRPMPLAWGAVVLIALAVARPAAAPAAGAVARGQEPLVTLGQASAEIRFPTPVRHAVLLQDPEKIRRLVSRGDILFHPQDPARSLTIERVEAGALVLREGPRGRPQALPAGKLVPGFPGLTFTGTVLLKEVHYRYRVVGRVARPDPMLVALEGSRAVLEVETAASPIPTGPAPGGAASSEVAAPRAPVLLSSPRATLDGTLLEKVRVREVAPGTYEVPAADVQAVLDNAGRVLADLAPRVLPTLSLQRGVQYRITSAAGDGVLTPQGFTVTLPKLAERAGIQVGDTIRSVNGRPADGFISLYEMLRDVRRDPAIREVQVELERRGTRLTKTYQIR